MRYRAKKKIAILNTRDRNSYREKQSIRYPRIPPLR